MKKRSARWGLVSAMIEWIGAAHYTPGRDGYVVDKIVPHIAEGPTMSGVDSTFLGSREASAHYCVDDWSIHQYVAEEDTAWSVGNWVENRRSISIEHVGTTANPPSRATLDRSAALMADIARRYGWTKLKLGENVGLHKWYTSTSCPSKLDVDYLINKSNEILEDDMSAQDVWEYPIGEEATPDVGNVPAWVRLSWMHHDTAGVYHQLTRTDDVSGRGVESDMYGRICWLGARTQGMADTGEDTNARVQALEAKVDALTSAVEALTATLQAN